MPKVPQYDSPQVAPQLGNSFRASPIADASAFGGAQAQQMGQLGQSVMQAGKAVTDYAMYSEEKKDKAIARDNLNKFRDEAREYMAGLHQKQGQEALDAYQQAQKQFEDYRKKYMTELKSERQRELFAASFEALTDGHLNVAMNFQERQRENFEKLTLDAENKTSIEDAIAQRYDPNAIKFAEETIKANTAAKYKGLGKAKDAAVTDAVNNLHKQILASHTADSPAKGVEYLKTNWDKFNPSVRSELKAQLDTLYEKEWVQEKAIAISSSGLSLEKQLAEVDKIKDADKATKLRSLVKDRYNEKNMIAELQNKQIREREVDKVFQDPMGYKVPLELAAADQEHLYDLRKKLVAEQLGGVEKSNLIVLNQLASMPYDEFRKVDLNKHIKDLNPSDYKSLLAKQVSGKEEFSPHARLTAYVKSMEQFDEKENGDEARIRKQNLLTQFQAQLNQLPPKEKTPEKIEAIITDLMKPATIKTGWFDGISDKEVFKFEVPYLDEQYKSLNAKQNMPESLKGFKNLQFHSESNRYYVDGQGVRKIFDVNGKLIKTYKLDSQARK